MTKIYGNRICRYCKGLCHNETYRSKNDTRSRYYCSRKCLQLQEEYNRLTKSKKFDFIYFPLDDKDFERYIDSYFEKVNVVAR